jgi:hypothetical protein
MRAVVASALIAGACTDIETETEPTFEAWKAQLPPSFKPGKFLVEGDIALDADELYDYWAYYALGRPTDLWLVQPPVPDTWSTVYHWDGEDSIYSATRKINLTYCISELFHGQHERVARLMDQATNEWERHAHINFIYRPEYDGDCERSNVSSTSEAFFTVERIAIAGTGLLADSFFPHEDGLYRILQVTDDGLAESDVGLLRTLRHELGHILGLRHEHAVAPVVCHTGEDSVATRQLTPLDTSSIMYYESCAGASAAALTEITRYDALGVRYLYNLPGHGREVIVFGVAYDHYTDFNSDGLTDVRWFDNDEATIDYLTYGDAALALAPTILGVGGSKPWVKPFAAHFVGDFTTDVFHHGPGDLPDTMHSEAVTDLPVYSFSVPLVGDFDGNTYGDILWYRPGPTADMLWLSTGEDVEVRSIAINGYYLPVVGDFSGDRRDDVFWYDPMGETSPVWRATGTAALFEYSSVDNAARGLPLGGSPFVPIPGDFNGDQRQDILWYRAGPDSDRMWLGNAMTPAGFSSAIPVSGSYRPIAGEFDADDRTDILWYAPGKGKDSIWYITGALTRTEVALEIAGDFAPFTGDFDGDSDTDLIWYQGDELWAPMWRADGMAFTNMPEVFTPTGSYPIGYAPIP